MSRDCDDCGGEVEPGWLVCADCRESRRVKLLVDERLATFAEAFTIEIKSAIAKAGPEIKSELEKAMGTWQQCLDLLGDKLVELDGRLARLERIELASRTKPGRV